ncbi:unnamed protein product [Amoebophrya sp. A25]|nr:unnamed protein product [Amoebophrya sp. A25]|eukprot:GSA25T00021865001.1
MAFPPPGGFLGGLPGMIPNGMPNGAPNPGLPHGMMPNGMGMTPPGGMPAFPNMMTMTPGGNPAALGGMGNMVGGMPNMANMAANMANMAANMTVNNPLLNAGGMGNPMLMNPLMMGHMIPTGVGAVATHTPLPGVPPAPQPPATSTASASAGSSTRTSVLPPGMNGGMNNSGVGPATTGGLLPGANSSTPNLNAASVPKSAPPAHLDAKNTSTGTLGSIGNINAGGATSCSIAVGPPPSTPATKDKVVKALLCVSRIPEGISDATLKGLLGACGEVKEWTRQSNPITNKLAKFALCEFSDMRGLSHAMTFLSGEHRAFLSEEMKLTGSNLQLRVDEDATPELEKFRKAERARFRKENPTLCVRIVHQKREGVVDVENEMKEGEQQKQESDAAVEEPITDEEVDVFLLDELAGVRQEIRLKIDEANAEYEAELASISPEEREERTRKAAEAEREWDARLKRMQEEKKQAEEAAARKKRDDEEREERIRKKDAAEDAKKRQKGAGGVLSANYRPHRKEREREDRYEEERRRQVREDEFAIRKFEKQEDKDLKSFQKLLLSLRVIETVDGNVTPMLTPGEDGTSELVPRSDAAYTRQVKYQLDQDTKVMTAPRGRRREVFEGLTEREKEYLKREKEKDDEDFAAERAEREKEEAERMREEQRALEERMKLEEERRAREAVERLTKRSSRSRSRSRRRTRDRSRRRGERHDDRTDGDRNKDREDAGDKASSSTVVKKDLSAVIQTIPEGSAVFGYRINWAVLEKHNLLENKVQPWISKKVKELYDKEEKGVIDYIFNTVLKVRDGSITTDDMLRELEKFLDEETQNLCIKLWRVIILFSLQYADASDE